jgi:molybdopterin synthase catalytic subunit
LGRVREFSSDDTVLALDIEHYPGMTEASLQDMAAVAVARFGLAGVRVVHRIGYLAAGEAIVLVVVSAAHRSASFQACEFLMDDLKTQAPFWKKEITAAGARWVEARSNDAAAWRRWQS